MAGILLAVRSGGGGEERAWLAAARHALAQPAWQCRPSGTPGQGLSLPGLGHVDRICVTAGVVSFVTEEQQPSGGFQPEGVLYVTGRAVARYPDACLAHLNGAWWRFVPPTPDCPSGYTISGGG